MRTANFYKGVLGAVLFFLLSASAGFADSLPDGLGTKYDLIILTPGHSRSIYYDLDNTLIKGKAFQTTFIITLGAGTLTVGLGNHSTLGQGEIVFATTGFVGTTPVLQYAYSSAPISMAIPVPGAGVGILITSVLTAVGDPDFPITMSMMFSLN
ncbi:MAG: hypothetical protein WCQ99_14555 [Pseudomonadota bacterium]